MHAEAYLFIAQALKTIEPPHSIIELGSRNVNGTPRFLLQGDVTYTGVDRLPGPGVDIIADAATYTPEELADLVLCVEVLEHADEAARVVKNALACVAPGGALIVTCATVGRAPHSSIDGGPLRGGEWYQNIDVDDLTAWIVDAGAEINRIVLDTSRGDLYALARVPA